MLTMFQTLEDHDELRQKSLPKLLIAHGGLPQLQPRYVSKMTFHLLIIALLFNPFNMSHDSKPLPQMIRSQMDMQPSLGQPNYLLSRGIKIEYWIQLGMVDTWKKGHVKSEQKPASW